MNPLFLAVLLCCLSINLCGQENHAQDNRNFIGKVVSETGKRTIRDSQLGHNRRPPAMDNESFRTLPALSNLKQSDPETRLRSLVQSHLTNQRTSNVCEDTSYSRLIGFYNAWLFVKSVTQTRDGGMLVCVEMYDSTRLPNPFWRNFGLLIKLDEDGNIIWKKQFEDLTPGSFSTFIISRAFELPNNDIVCVGIQDNDPNMDVYKTMVYRLTPSGDVIWQNSIKSSIGIFNSPPGTFTFFAESAVEGLNGDVILCGTTNSNLSSGKIETVVRLSNQGELIWDANYGNHGPTGSYRFGAEGITAFVENGKIILVGLSHGSNYPQTAPAINFLTLDYSTGNMISKRFFRPDYTDDLEEFYKSFTYWANKCIRLPNGHLIFYGKLFSDIVRATPVKDHFGVVEFDASFNLVDAYTISSGLTTNYYNNVLHIDSTAKGVLSVFEYISSYSGNVFFGAFKDLQFQNQRKAYYNEVGMPGNNGFAFLPDGGYAYMQSYFQNPLPQKSYIEFRKMHNSDTSSVCLGKDTMLLEFLPLRIIEDTGYYFLDPNEPNKMVEYSQYVDQTDTISSSVINPCRQTNYCDTVKIHGDTVLCGGVSSVTFTAFKNSACGAIVQWDIDDNAIDSMKVLSDTSIRIWFRNINWQGKLFARLPVGRCDVSGADSVLLGLTRSQVPVDLGADTVLCNQNITLHAGTDYSAYLWQDGSTDSIFTVSAPGQYWVQVEDFCGNIFVDTVLVEPFIASVSIGPDREKCNNDTVRLRASTGFMNYTWGPVYNIVSSNGYEAVVNPLVDTIYYVRAEKYPGCYVYDTLKVKVNRSPDIDLGPDKNLCSGDTALLDAGPGFDQYQWSNGLSSRQISVTNAATFSVIATTAAGCRSYDTMKILNVWPRPVVSLDNNNELCAGSFRTLYAGNFAAYVWQDGSSASSYTVRDTGTYYVRVWDNNQCTGSDTVYINKLLPLPDGFLPAEMAICNYGSIELRPSGNYSQYTWSNGASTSYINISRPGIFWLQVKDAKNCIGTDTVIIKSKDCLKGFYMPTAFTPDRNGKNDYLKPIIGGVVKQYQLSVYNRWGQLVFSSVNHLEGWDGTLKGIPQGSNVFAWVCKYQLEGEPVIVKKGTVVLIR